MKEKKQPLRMCIACRQMKEKKNLIRVVKTSESNFILDKTGKANGRGAYLCDESTCFEKCVKQKCLNRAFKENVPAEVLTKLKGEFFESE